MKNIIKTLVLVMTLVLVLVAFTGCETECVHQGGEATCEKKAVCELCGEEYGELAAHKETYSSGLDATCTEPGYTVGMKCSVCSKVFIEVQPISPTGHTMEDKEGLASTCSQPGYTAYQECTVCGAIEGKNEIPTIDHTLEDAEGLEPTCTEDGYTAYQKCTVCNAEVGKEVIPAAHKVGEDGVCTECGYTVVDTVEELLAAIKVANGKVIVLAGTYELGNFSVAAGLELVGEGEVVLAGTLTNTLDSITIKNLTIQGGNAQRWAYAKGDCVFEGVTFDATSVYALHFDGITAGTNLLYKDCTIIGWAAMGGSPASCVFDGCTIKGNGTYGVIRTYFDVTVKNCTFDVANVNTEDVYQDGLHVVGATMTLENCENLNGEMKDIIDTSGNGYVVIGEETIHIHKFEDVEAKAATCVAEGYTAHKACPCGEAEGKEVIDIDAENHVGYTSVTTEPTCTTAGKVVYTCECGDKYEEAGADVLPHADENGDFKCDACAAKMLPADGTALTIPQALAVAKVAGTAYTTQKYYITGIVTNVYNTQYGNLYLKDAEGNEICIYGLYTWDKAVRYDKMEYKPVEGDELTVYTVLGMYGTTCQGKDAWMDEVVAHEHNYEAEVTDPGCLTTGYTTHTCSICKASYVDSEVAALGHTTEEGTCERCGATIGGDAPVIGTLATFDFGANGSASHVDGNDYGSSKSFTSGTYTLALTGMSKVYGPAYDAKGNSCIKLGTSKLVGAFSFTVPENVTEVVIYVAKYKSNSTTIKVNGTSYTLTKNSNDGAYDVITIDTTTTKTVTLTTVASTYRAMVNTIVFNGYAQ